MKDRDLGLLFPFSINRLGRVEDEINTIFTNPHNKNPWSVHIPFVSELKSTQSPRLLLVLDMMDMAWLNTDASDSVLVCCLCCCCCCCWPPCCCCRIILKMTSEAFWRSHCISHRKQHVVYLVAAFRGTTAKCQHTSDMTTEPFMLPPSFLPSSSLRLSETTAGCCLAAAGLPSERTSSSLVPPSLRWRKHIHEEPSCFECFPPPPAALDTGDKTGEDISNCSDWKSVPW